MKGALPVKSAKLWSFKHLIFLAQFLVMKCYKLLKSKILEQGKEKKNVRNYYRYFIGSLVNRVGNIQYVRRHSASVIGNCSGSFCYSSVNRKKSSLVLRFKLTGNKFSGVHFSLNLVSVLGRGFFPFKFYCGLCNLENSFR